MSSRFFAFTKWASTKGNYRVMEGAAGVVEASATANSDRLFERNRIEIARPALDIRASSTIEKLIHYLARRT